MSETATADQLLQQGLFHHRQGEITLAMERYSEVLRINPQNADALYYIAVVACQEGQYQQGIDLARRSLAYNRGQARAHNLIGQALHRLGKTKEALDRLRRRARMRREFRRGLRQPRRDAERTRPPFRRRCRASTARSRSIRTRCRTWINRGVLLQQLGRAEEALASFDKADALMPDNAAILTNRGMALAALGRHDEALAALDRALALDANFAEAQRARAGVLEALGRPEEARAALAKATEVEARMAEVREKERAKDDKPPA